MPPFRGITPRRRGSRFYPRQREPSGTLEGFPVPQGVRRDDLSLHTLILVRTCSEPVPMCPVLNRQRRCVSAQFQQVV
jgi:hypothetical protein